MYEIPNSPCARRGRIRRKQPIEVLNDSSWEQLAELTQSSFSIRFKVRGGFRQTQQRTCCRVGVSIRFKVRGAPRELGPQGSVCSEKFQSASRFAVLPEFVAVAVKCAASASFNPLRGSRCSQSTASAPAWIRERFNPLRGSRCSQSLPHDTPSRQAPLPRSYTPPPLTPSEQRTESVLNGVNPLVKWHTHLRLFLVVLQHPCPRVSPRCPVAGSWASSSESTSGRVPSRGAGSGPGRGRVCCSAAGSGFDTAVR